MPYFKTFYYRFSQRGTESSLPVVLLHGEGMSSRFWSKNIRCLARQNVYALDLPGHGGDRAVAFQSVQLIADSVYAFLQGMGILHSAVIGHSLGAAVALTLAWQHPAHIIAVALINAAATFPLSPELLDYMRNPATFSTGQQLLLEKFCSPYTSKTLRETAEQALLQTRPTALYSDLLALDGFDLTRQLNQITCPVYAVAGKEDRFISPVRSQALSAEVPIARMDLMSRCGHLLPLECSGSLEAGLSRFLRDLQSWHRRESNGIAFPAPVRPAGQRKQNH